MGGNAATVEKCVFPACRKITNTKRVDAVIRVQKRRGCGAPKSTTTSSWTTDEIESMKWIHGQTTYRERRRSGRTSGAADVSLPNPGFRLILFLTTTHSPSPSKQHKNRTILCKRFTFLLFLQYHATPPHRHLTSSAPSFAALKSPYIAAAGFSPSRLFPSDPCAAHARAALNRAVDCPPKRIDLS